MLEDEYCGKKMLFEVEYERGYREGLRLGICISVVKMFRRFLRKYGRENTMRRLELEEDIYDELMMFHEKYKDLPANKMAERIVAESEYLIGFD